MAFGQFMALIDIQIVAASLNDVQAGLSAGPDEISWVQTAYLMAELVMIPFSAFLAQALSTRWLFALSAGAVHHRQRAVRPGLGHRVDDRCSARIQGFVGGAMVPTVFATGFALFDGQAAGDDPGDPRHGLGAGADAWARRSAAGSPTRSAGAGSSSSTSCPGIAVTVLALLLIRVDRPNLVDAEARSTGSHLASMAVFLGGLEYVLEEGPQQRLVRAIRRIADRRLAVVRRLRCCSSSARSARAGRSCKLTPFRKPTFAFACVFNLVIGFGLYAATYLMPVFLGRVRGYNSLQIGTTVFVTGIAQICSACRSPRGCRRRVDPAHRRSPSA